MTCEKVWLHQCSSVLRINLWRKRGIVSRLAQGRWFEFHPAHNESVIYPSQLTFDSLAEAAAAMAAAVKTGQGVQDAEEILALEQKFWELGAWLNVVKEKEYPPSPRSARTDHFNFSESIPGFNNVQVSEHNIT